MLPALNPNAAQAADQFPALVRALLEHPELATISRWVLNTRDAHGLYAKFGFVPVQPGPNAMERRR